MQQNDVIIRLDHITKSYGDKVVLDDINLEIKRGEFVPSWVRPAAEKPPHCVSSQASSHPTRAL